MVATIFNALTNVLIISAILAVVIFVGILIVRRAQSGTEVCVLPHNLDAERAVIGAMLVSETAVAVIREMLSAEDFYSETHRVLYEAIMGLYSRGDPIDQLTLTDELKNLGEFDRIGGCSYVFRLVESVPTAANVANYAGEILHWRPS